LPSAKAIVTHSRARSASNGLSRCLGFRRKNAGLDRSSNLCNDDILIEKAGAQSQHVALCPDMKADAAINQMNDHTAAMARSSQSTDNQVAGAQLARNGLRAALTNAIVCDNVK
jgi:hypothetical protein